MTWGTIAIKDGGGTSRTVPAFDVSGAGTGPYIIGHTLVNDSGDGFATVEENAAAVATLLGVAGRYDASDRTLGDGDAGALALTARGQLRTVLETAAGVAVTPISQVNHDAVDSGAPLKTGGKAVAGLSNLTLVAAADRTDASYGTDGALITRPHCGLEDIVSATGTATSSTSNTQALAAGAAGIKHYLTSVMVTNTSATDTEVVLKDGTTAKATLSVPANGGVNISFPVPLPGSAATAWNFACADSVDSVVCSVIGFKSKV